MPKDLFPDSGSLPNKIIEPEAKVKEKLELKHVFTGKKMTLAEAYEDCAKQLEKIDTAMEEAETTRDKESLWKIRISIFDQYTKLSGLLKDTGDTVNNFAIFIDNASKALGLLPSYPVKVKEIEG